MKKILSIIMIVFCASLIIGQTQNKNLNQVQKATAEWANTYNFTPEQMKSAVKIQENKYLALQKIETLKTVDLKKYNAKKFSILETTDNELAVLLDERQTALFKKEQAEKSKKYTNAIMAMKKKGTSDIEMQKKIAEMSF
jgi:hypothetical protein